MSDTTGLLGVEMIDLVMGEMIGQKGLAEWVLAQAKEGLLIRRPLDHVVVDEFASVVEVAAGDLERDRLAVTDFASRSI